MVASKDQIKTEREAFDSIDEGVMRKIHHDSSQQGAEYMYTCIHNEFEWAVFRKEMAIGQANAMLANFALDIGVKAQRVNKDYLLGSVTPYALRPSNRKTRD